SRKNSVMVHLLFLPRDSAFQIISVCKGASLGLDIAGGIDRNEGPLVYVQEIIPGGDCHKDGRLQPGDQLVSINKESMIGVSYEEARSIIDRARARYVPLPDSYCRTYPNTNHGALKLNLPLKNTSAISRSCNFSIELALRSRIHLAEAAQRQARGMEMDYEEVIRLLEAEIVELKAQLSDHCGQNKDSIQDLRKRVTVLDCQLRKSESARKSFEVATEKLLQFVEVTCSSPLSFSDRRTPLSSKALLARLGRIGPTVTTALAAEARDLAKSVRAILEVNCETVHCTQVTDVSWVQHVTDSGVTSSEINSANKEQRSKYSFGTVLGMVMESLDFLES
uniref:Syntaxin binding protein 4 n=1 Tax=Pavo cristatus TaxID=9049 RepID=A0A8C9FFY7_PAVCR